MKKGIYVICKILNWVLPGLLFYFAGYSEQFYYNDGVVEYFTVMGYLFMYIGFLFFKIRGMIRGQDRELYEWIPIVGNVIVMILLYVYIWPSSRVHEVYSSQQDFKTIYFNYNLFKFTLMPFVVAIIANRIYCLKYETTKYEAGSKQRAVRAQNAHERDLDRNIDRYAKKVADATTFDDRRYYELELERAKSRREKYFVSKDRTKK